MSEEQRHDEYTPTSLKPLAEGFQTIEKARAAFANFWIRAIPIVAVIYGAIAWSAYYFFLGLAALGLIWFMDRRFRQAE
jgi:hypothetical protein